MRRADRLGLALFLLLALVATGLGARLARRAEQGGGARLELGRLRPTALTARTSACFAALRERVLVTYYVSAPERMPSAMRRMRLEVADLLSALRARFPERFDFHVVDPESEAGLEGFAARRRVAPFRVRSIAHDAWDERTVWSTLALAYGTHPEALLRGLGPEHLPHLQELLVAWLEELERPRQPRLALAAPEEGFQELADALAERGPLTLADLDASAALPDVDALLWMRPRHVTSAQLRGLEHLLASGASVLVAGSLLEPFEEVREEVPWVAFRRPPSAMTELAAHFGLALEPGLTLDRTAEALDFGDKEIAAPHWIRCIAPNQDFHRFATQPNGTLLFRAPSTLWPVPARLSELGRTAEVLATTSDNSWLVPEPPSEPRELTSLTRDSEHALAKQALLVTLRHDRPWQGELSFAGAATPFEDGFLHREHVAHPRLLDVWLNEATASERLVLRSIDLALPEPLPAFGANARFWLRLLVLAVPVVLLVGIVHRRSLLGAAREFLALVRRAGRAVVVPGPAVLAALLLVGGVRAFDLGLDLSAERLNSLPSALQAIAARASGPLAATLYASERLPPGVSAGLHALEGRLADLGRAGLDLDVQRIVPEDLSPAERAALASRGIESTTGATRTEDVTAVARFTCALRFAQGEREAVLAFPDARAFERLDFRLGFALERLAGARTPRVAFASDIPRLSAAEAYEYQKQSLFAPGGTDVYALARASLAANDLAVEHVNPRAPVLPEASDVLVWLQPRRSIEPMLELAVRYLHGGGTLVLAAQHFNLKPQQFRGGDFTPQFWPQPQNPDLEHLYFPELSIELTREVLFDELDLPIAAESQVTGRQGAPDFERQQSALPFQIRLAAAGLVPHPITRGLGDQSFLFANRIRWDDTRLKELGLSATPLAFTSPRTWSFAWKGGWIPHELLKGPAALEGSSGADYLGPQPVMVLFEGRFPRPTKPLELNPSSSPPPEGAEQKPVLPWPEPGAGRLLLIGDAEFLENGALGTAEFRGDQLLWNAVASSVFEDELAELATRTRTPRGFGWVSPARRLLGRALVVGAGPLVLALFATALWFLRHRAPAVRR